MTDPQPPRPVAGALGDPAAFGLREPVEQPFTPDTGPHSLRARTTQTGTEYVCACGQWDGYAKAGGSGRATQFVHLNHATHKRLAEEAEQQEAAERAEREARALSAPHVEYADPDGQQP